MRKSALLLGAGVVSAVSLLAASSAFAADPPTPPDSAVTFVGSDTIQAVTDQFATDYTASQLVSYDAVGAGLSSTDQITTKTGCAPINRPVGSGAGISQLTGARPSGDSTDYCVDVARSSRGLKTGDPSGLVWIPFAVDSVTWAAPATGNAPLTLTALQLQAIYTCNASILDSSKSGPVTWDEVGGKGTDAVVPVIPQSSSGTRSFFQTEINAPSLGSCVKGTDDSVPENEGSSPIFNGRGVDGKKIAGVKPADIVFPYSSAVYLAQDQNGHGDATNNPGQLSLRKVGGVSPTRPASSGSTTLVLNTGTFPFLRNVFYVTRSTGSAAHYVPTYLQAFLGKNNATGWICSSATAKADIQSYGFAPMPKGCGVEAYTS